MKIPAVPSAASEFPTLIFGKDDSARGVLKRPADNEMRDGALDRKDGTDRSTHTLAAYAGLCLDIEFPR